MWVTRLKWHVYKTIDQHQYGFMPQKSTEDSLYDLVKMLKQHIIGKRIAILISLDVEGAFDNAWWPKMKAEIAARKCPGNLQRVLSSYLEGRSIKINYAGEVLEKNQTRGCVQGSIAGPTLWNVILDPLIRHFTQSNDVHCQAFADDVVLVIAGEKLTELTQITDKALDWVHKWGLENKLNFSPAKTNAMILTRKHIDRKGIQLKMNGIVIPIVKDFKLLGIQLDDGLTFNNHVTLMCKKLLPDREYEARVPYTNTPHPVDLAPLTFEKVEDLSEETVAKYQIEGLRIFTDGSKIEGKVTSSMTHELQSTDCSTQPKDHTLISAEVNNAEEVEPYYTTEMNRIYTDGSKHDDVEIKKEEPQDSSNKISRKAHSCTSEPTHQRSQKYTEVGTSKETETRKQTKMAAITITVHNVNIRLEGLTPRSHLHNRRGPRNGSSANRTSEPAITKPAAHAAGERTDNSGGCPAPIKNITATRVQ
ncbi:uncharacterized protein LOC134670985 [Cydia fagiglandana]|uniref:uncharacterized protein LOC134670985 n=1 Tax=Cydia fagiglandana TaxID=1458189 RepID=UPI002FEE460C